MWTGLSSAINGKEETRNQTLAISFFLIGSRTEAPTMWASWKGAKTVLSIPWRVILRTNALKKHIVKGIKEYMGLAYQYVKMDLTADLFPRSI